MKYLQIRYTYLEKKYFLKRDECMDPEYLLCYHCAPVLIGLKPSCMISVGQQDAISIINIADHILLKVIYLDRSDQKCKLFLYNPKLLQRTVYAPTAAQHLKQIGYRLESLEGVLAEFGSRYHSFLVDKTSFPHELGIFLGYPLEDIHGFIEHNGQDFLFHGYWKVYSRQYDADLLFRKYDIVREIMLRGLDQGLHVQDMIRKKNNCDR